MLDEGTLADTVVIGIDYDEANYGEGHGTETWTASHRCDFSHWWVVPNVGSA